MLVSRSGASLADVFTGFKTSFNKGFEGFKPTIGVIAMEVPSTAAEETYVWLGSFPSIREWAGERVIQNLSAWKYAITNKTFEATVKVGATQIEDDQYGLFAPLMQEMGRAAAEHPDRLAYDLLKGGFNHRCYDGQYFFDADHPVIDESGATVSVSNVQAGAGEPWFLIDASRVVRPLVFQKRRPYRFVSLDRPTDERAFWHNEFIYGCDGRSNVGFGLWQLAYASKADLTVENYQAARAAMGRMTGDGGRKLGIRPTHMIVPLDLEGRARTILNATTAEGGASNIWANTAELVVSPYL